VQLQKPDFLQILYTQEELTQNPRSLIVVHEFALAEKRKQAKAMDEANVALGQAVGSGEKLKSGEMMEICVKMLVSRF